MATDFDFIKTQLANITYMVQRFNGTGAQTSFLLAEIPASDDLIAAFINGVLQPNTNFSLSGQSVVFGSAPPSGVGNVEIVVAPYIAHALINAEFIVVGGQSLPAALTKFVAVYGAYSEAQAAAATLPDGQRVEVEADENHDGIRTRYFVQDGLVVFAGNVDQLRIDLTDEGMPPAEVLDSMKPIANYTALRNYTGRATGVRITQVGLSGFFQRDDADTSTADNGGTCIVDSAERRWKRVRDAGTVHVDWFGAKAISGSEAVNATAILAAHNYCAGQTRDKTVLFGAGAYPFNTTLVLRGIVEWVGPTPGSAGTTLEWTGSAAVALSLDPGEWYGNYQGTFRKIRIARAPSASRAVGFDLIRCSEYEFQDVHVSDMGTAFKFQGAPINYFDRIVTDYCDVVFDYSTQIGIFGNANHNFTRCNFWETSDCVFKFTGGEAYAIYLQNSNIERFGTFIKNGENTPEGLNIRNFRVSKCHLLATDSPNSRLIYYKAKPGNYACIFRDVTFEDSMVLLNSSDHVCYIDNNGNTASSTLLFENLSFHNVAAYGAATALVYSNKFGTTVRATGSTVAQQGDNWGNVLSLAYGDAIAVETNSPQFYGAIWSGDGAAQPSIGDGALNGSYIIESGMIRVRIEAVFGPATQQGNGIWRFSMPFSGLGAAIGSAFLSVPGVGNYACTVIGNTQGGFVSLALNTTGNLVPFGITTNPTTSLTIEYSYAAG